MLGFDRAMDKLKDIEFKVEIEKIEKDKNCKILCCYNFDKKANYIKFSENTNYCEVALYELSYNVSYHHKQKCDSLYHNYIATLAGGKTKQECKKKLLDFIK